MAALLPSNSSGFSGNDKAEIDWNNLGFGLTPTDYMYMMKCSKDYEFKECQLLPFGNIKLSPASAVLNYGQILPAGKGTLYIRPLLLGTGATLDVVPAPEYTFLTYAIPVGNFFKEGNAAVNLYVEDQFDRASRGGVGDVKSITNYAPGLKPRIRAKNRGFSDVLYLDSVSGKYVEEASTSNIFMVKDKTISTPPIKGTILPGVTRKSIIEIARDQGFIVQERLIAVDEMFEAEEVFCCGTAVVIIPVGSLTHLDKRVDYEISEANLVSKRLLSTYIAIQNGKIEDNKGWLVEIN